MASKVAPHLIGLDLHGAQYVHGQVVTFGQYAAEQVLGTDAQRTVSSRLELPDGFKPLGT